MTLVKKVKQSKESEVKPGGQTEILSHFTTSNQDTDALLWCKESTLWDSFQHYQTNFIFLMLSLPLFPRFNDHFSRWIWVRRYQNVSILDFAKDDGGGGDNWSYRTCKAPVKSSPPTNQHPAFTGRMPFLSPNQQCQSTWREIPSHIYTVW